ncbi:MAG: hypothetical protein M3Z04_17995 [Chloroflexota bacterium]|nr:hypothetical protein [Chloroflexota bacterium]
MAQTLHDQYGYSYDTLKVLLGGWSAWKSANYPIATSEGAAPPATALTPLSTPLQPGVRINGGGATPLVVPVTPKP